LANSVLVIATRQQKRKPISIIKFRERISFKGLALGEEADFEALPYQPCTKVD